MKRQFAEYITSQFAKHFEAIFLCDLVILHVIAFEN